jgi:hypothetical protein
MPLPVLTLTAGSGVIKNLRLFKLASVLVRFDHVARIIVNANDSVCERLRNSAWLIRVDSSVYLGALYSTRKCGGCLKFAPIFRV